LRGIGPVGIVDETPREIYDDADTASSFECALGGTAGGVAAC